MVPSDVPRRARPERLFILIGKRVRGFRLAAALTQEEVADAHGNSLGLTHKGHVSSLEHGLVNPTVETLQRIAECLSLPLQVELVDLIISPESSPRHAVIDLTRTLSEHQLHEILATYGPPPELKPKRRTKTPNRAENTRRKTR